MYGITGASGQLGRLVIAAMLKRVAPQELVAIVRDRESVRDIESRGIAVREADYDQPETVLAAVTGIDRLLFISSNAIGRRVPQHRAVIEAARAANVGLLI